MRTTIEQTIDFGKSGTSEGSIVYGWSITEPDHTWTDGKRSVLCLDAPKAPHGFALEITWSPYAPTPAYRAQTVTIGINGRVLGNHVVDRLETVAFFCPAPRPGERRILVELDIPTAVAPKAVVPGHHDERLLGLSVQRVRVLRLDQPCPALGGKASKILLVGQEIETLTAEVERHSGLAAAALFEKFEVLAGNCDMGLALREAGFDNLSLLRFAGAGASVALRGLDTDFDGVGESLTTDVARNPAAEWMVNDAFGLRYHSGQSSRTMSEERVLKGQRRHVKFLRQKFLEDLAEGEKIFVYADQHAVRPLESALPLFFALNRHRPTRMLWVSLGENHNRGRVDEVLPGLARGTIDRFAPPLAAGHISVAGWLTMLCNAWLVLGRPRP